MISFLHKQEAVARMNRWGSEQRPFLFIIDYLQQQIVVETPDQIDAGEIRYNLNGFTNTDEPTAAFTNRQPFSWKSFPQPESHYARSFQLVQDEIYAGNSYLVNLTCSTPVETNLSLTDICTRSRASYKLGMKDPFVVFSPEIFVRIPEDQVFSAPMKGTIDATLPDAAGLLLADEKEEAEHATIVDLIRNDLSRIASDVRVSRYRYLDEIRTNRGALLQASSEICGTLPANWHQELGTLFFRLLPAGSITGAPKKKTMEIIAEAETSPRGFYTGIAGYFDGSQLDSAVMIRFIEQQGNSLCFKSGGGITAQSMMQHEYNEMKQKVYVPIPLSGNHLH